MSNSGSPRFTDFPSLCACSEPSLPNLIGSGLNLLYLQSHSKPECRWTRPEVAILGADQKERGLWGREWCLRFCSVFKCKSTASVNRLWNKLDDSTRSIKPLRKFKKCISNKYAVSNSKVEHFTIHRTFF